MMMEIRVNNFESDLSIGISMIIGIVLYAKYRLLNCEITKKILVSFQLAESTRNLCFGLTDTPTTFNRIDPMAVGPNLPKLWSLSSRPCIFKE